MTAAYAANGEVVAYFEERSQEQRGAAHHAKLHNCHAASAAVNWKTTRNAELLEETMLRELSYRDGTGAPRSVYGLAGLAGHVAGRHASACTDSSEDRESQPDDVPFSKRPALLTIVHEPIEVDDEVWLLAVDAIGLPVIVQLDVGPGYCEVDMQVS